MTDNRGLPSNLRSLEARIANAATTRGRTLRRIQRVVANTVVGQMLPPGVVKGGTAMKLRVGEGGSRFTPDLDAVRATNLTLDDYLDDLAARLAVGWSDFTGTVEELDPPRPEGVPDDYVMQPFALRMAYRGRHWLKVIFELGHDEVGSTSTHDERMPADILGLFSELGLETPAPIPVLALDHQIAQKLHACTSISPRTGGNERAHDLVDLQILEQEEQLDLAAIDATATRLFAARRQHAWPPVIVAHGGWATIYAEAADGLDVRPEVDDAVTWANDFVGRIIESRGPS